MYLVTFIGPDKLEQRELDVLELDIFFSLRGENAFDAMAGSIPEIVVKRINSEKELIPC